ncbi:MAG TPA: ECF-type sigma factor [Bryobacteraceae bacterium]|nr:ECF-type sigma factor [Bryobacteraceae bacterium]
MSNHSITALLHQARNGDATARDALTNALYGELHRLAQIAFQRENPGHTLQPTILVHEAFLRLLKSEGGPQFADRAHFLGLAARVMRQILVDHGRARHAQKRGAQFTVALSDRVEAAASPVTFLELNNALDILGREESDLVSLVEMRFLAGMTAEEVAEVRRESVTKVRRDLRYALARLRMLLSA